jgi:uncharacterized membrane protein YeiH
MLDILEFIAVVAAGTYGILHARAKRMDLIGVFTIAFLTALGGGTLRDLILDRDPIFWVRHQEYAISVFVMVILATFIKTFPPKLERALYIPDAVGLALFTILGADYALQAGAPLFAAAIIGVVNGAFGGVIADIMCDEIPSLFVGGPLYATCAFLGAWIYFGFLQLLPDSNVPYFAALSFIIILRLAAVHWGIRLKGFDALT